MVMKHPIFSDLFHWACPRSVVISLEIHLRKLWLIQSPLLIFPDGSDSLFRAHAGAIPMPHFCNGYWATRHFKVKMGFIVNVFHWLERFSFSFYYFFTRVALTLVQSYLQSLLTILVFQLTLRQRSGIQYYAFLSYSRFTCICNQVQVQWHSSALLQVQLSQICSIFLNIELRGRAGANSINTTTFPLAHYDSGRADNTVWVVEQCRW